MRLSEADRATYRAAFSQWNGKKYKSAQELATKAINPLPAKVIRWLDLIRKEPEANFSEYALFLQQNAHWPRQRKLRARAEKVMPADLSDKNLLAWFDTRSPVTVDGALRYAEALERAGHNDRAVGLLREVWIEFNLTHEQELAFHERYGKLLRRQDHVSRLDRLLWKRRAKSARRQARRVGRGYVELAEARLLLAYRRPGVDRAVKRVPRKLREDPGFIYDRARWRRRKGRYRGVVQLLDPPRPEAPYPEFWWPLRKWAAREALDKKSYKVAYRLTSHHGFERGLGFAEGEWLAGWVALRFIKDAKSAYQHFVRMYEGVSTPVSRARGAFWAGEAARAKGSGKWAKHWYRLAATHTSTYYGQLAAKRLGQTAQVALPEPFKPGQAERDRFDRQELVQVVRLLGDLGQEGIQKIFLDRLRLDSQTASDFALTAELALQQGRPDLALRAAKEARKLDMILSQHLYPLPGLPKADGVDQTLLLSLIRQESEFYSNARSRAGARGLMQLMPRTAKRVARKLKVRYRRSKLTADPAYNMRLGAAYLKQLLKRYGGYEVLALAAYNAGPHRVDRWIKRYGDPRKRAVDPIDWAERIPFAETRNYVQRILETMPIYRARLNERRADLPLNWATAGFPDKN